MLKDELIEISNKSHKYKDEYNCLVKNLKLIASKGEYSACINDSRYISNEVIKMLIEEGLTVDVDVYRCPNVIISWNNNTN